MLVGSRRWPPLPGRINIDVICLVLDARSTLSCRDLRHVAAGRGFLQLGLDVLPRIELASLLRNALEEIEHVGKRREPQNFLAVIDDDERSGQGARPVRAAMPARFWGYGSSGVVR